MSLTVAFEANPREEAYQDFHNGEKELGKG